MNSKPHSTTQPSISGVPLFGDGATVFMVPCVSVDSALQPSASGLSTLSALARA